MTTLRFFRARSKAGSSGADWIEPKHLLLGFLIEDQEAAFFTGEQVEKLREELAQSPPMGAQPKPTSVDMPVAKAAQLALLAAHEHAAGSKVTPLHILWALISDPENSVSGFLKSHALTAGQIDQAISSRQ